MYVKVSLLSIKDRQADVLEESYQNIHFGSEKLFGTKFLKYVVYYVLKKGHYITVYVLWTMWTYVVRSTFHFVSYFTKVTNLCQHALMHDKYLFSTEYWTIQKGG